MEKIEQRKLRDSILIGAKQVISNKKELNQINVFPVSDGDTGSNLSSLMQSILDNVVYDYPSVSLLLEKVSEAALIGARGNSGMIFAQYLTAVSELFAQKDSDTEGLVYSFKEAIHSVYEALIDPQEGTILTVMTVWSDSMVKNYEKNSSFKQALIEAKNDAKSALVETQFQMSVLKKNKTVDAGAKGFYYFIEGLTDTYCGEDIKQIFNNESTQEMFIIEKVEHAVSAPPEFRYCSEFIILHPKIAINQLKKQLVNYGNSVIVIGNSSQLKIHIHTNEPKELLFLLQSYGKIIYQKVDDMLLQYQDNNCRRSSVAIVTDSIADIPDELVLKHNIHVIPIPILGEDESYLDKLTVDSQTLFEKNIDISNLSSSQPTVQSIDNLFSFLQGKYEHVIVLTVSSKLSGTYQLVNQRLNAINVPQNFVHVIDSRLNSAAQGLLVLKAAELSEQGYQVGYVVKQIESSIRDTFIYVAVGDLTPMLNSGRIPKSLGNIVKKLHFFPIVSLNEEGDGSLSSVTFSQKRSVNKIVKRVKKFVRSNEIECLAISHVHSKEYVTYLKECLKECSSQIDFVVESSATIAISAGQGSIAIAGIKKGGK